MKKPEARLKVIEKVNVYLKDKMVTIEGEHPMEEYTTHFYPINVLREALEQCFNETYRLLQNEELALKPKLVAVICFDLDDFREWKHLKGHANYRRGTHKSYLIDNTMYYGIYHVIDLCSLAVDEIVTTSYAHKNPEYEEIMRIAEANLNTPIKDVKDNEM